jgi:hypothetical protein
MRDRIDHLHDLTAAVWRRMLETSPFFAAWETGACDRRLLALYYVETYHYTLHNARNQALVGVQHLSASPAYVQFCFEHAEEETGHEMMAFHDLKRMVERPDLQLSDLPPPLPATETLIGYLYWISSTGNPLRRLGYSFWAEDSYRYFMPTLHRVRDRLGLVDADLTFLIAHANIDEKHAHDVHEQLLRHCRTESDWDAVGEVLVTSLELTGRVLDAVQEQWQRVGAGDCARVPFIARGPAVTSRSPYAPGVRS